MLRYVENDNVAFGLVRAVVRALGRGRRAVDVGFAAVFAGSIGNLVDRVTRGRVVDLIDVQRWPVFNVADILIVAGVALVVLGRRRDRPRRPRRLRLSGGAPGSPSG